MLDCGVVGTWKLSPSEGMIQRLRAPSSVTTANLKKKKLKKLKEYLKKPVSYYSQT
jgi:hypothetical protein